MTNKELVKTWFEKLDAQDFSGIRNLMDDRHQFHNPMTPAPIGADEHIGMMQMMHNSFSGEHIINLMLEEGNHVAVSGTWKGTHSGEFQGIPATGNVVNFTFSDFFQVVDGKVLKEHMELNPLSINAQIGAPAPQEA